MQAGREKDGSDGGATTSAKRRGPRSEEEKAENGERLDARPCRQRSSSTLLQF